ncbi:MAG TPA: M1 family aminopeptidase [Bacteroidia bacterium]|jgi:aminopeptidase N|nr:M1 family aminopeptidase [Bacteroidia bacterium]
MKKIFLSLFSLFVVMAGAKAGSHDVPDTNGLRSDTVNVLNYVISLNVTDFTTDTLRGNTVVKYVPKMNGINTVSLDLLHFKVDSVFTGATHLQFSYDDTLLIVDLPTTENIGDTNSIQVYYHGKPVLDPTGFGGFYFSGGYAFNLGVGFAVKPHNFGRCWYPCFDNFIAKSTFTFHITSDTANLSFCNGYLTKDSVSGATRTRTWVMQNAISSYLACVDVAPYTTILDTFRGIDTIPIVIAGEPGDTAKIKRSFVHLKNAISIFQNCYGKYRWNKVGYSMVPFSGGAMEHASNIAYPVLAANGSLAYEANIMAHELSHHWCGDLVTCSTAEDMWLNEGFAVFNQSIFEQYVYGDSTYHTYTRANHENAVHYCAISDHGYWPLSGMPQTYTYGNLHWISTTYDKGSDIFYTLRTYLGDSNFFNGMKYYFAGHAYQPVSADTLKHSLERYSGYNLTDFFNNWVYAPGFPQFSIDSMTVVPNGNNFNATVFIKQKLMNAPAYYTNVPVEVNFKSANMKGYAQTVMVSGNLSNYTITVPFNPVFAGVNMRTKIAEAKSSDTLVITKTGNYNMSQYSRVNLTVNSVTDTAFLYLEHNYAAPDPIRDTALHYRLSPYRYWNISGVRQAGFKGTARLYFDGRKVIGVLNGSCYLDTDLMPVNCDSLLLVYKPDTKAEWQEFPGYTKSKITPVYGYMTLDSLPNGQYTFANGVSHVLAIDDIAKDEGHLKIYPNPASGSFTVDVPLANTTQSLSIFSIEGKLMAQLQVAPEQTTINFNSAEWKNGTYIISLSDGEKNIDTENLVINH